MWASIRCAVPPDASQHLAAAVHWAQAFHPGVEATILDDTALLSSNRHDVDALQAIWASALANERLAHDAAPIRAAMLATLLG